MGAAFTKCLGSVTSDPKKMGMIVSKSFGMFDKDKSGYIEAAEAKAAAEQVITMAKLQGKVKPEMLDSVFNKAAGTDKKLDQAEFQAMISEVLKKAGVDAAMPPAPAAPAAAAAAPAAAPAPAAAADAAAAPPAAVPQ
ncbi:hypothetical protein OEZ86_006758 [Tetradesmus obliquus]|uniref:EF-hand domain-containing protein n=1 Tax=Tetradesmus obliquus TaxID=3088 RepID=A0A383VG05_TETOB|nr:hypothetical protein OEZ86_006758 [Tetradesmus obliquus]|eukprot:jgi/Sobl393_1/4398/SZX63672.1